MRIISMESITPTLFIKKKNDTLYQLVKVCIKSNAKVVAGEFVVFIGEKAIQQPIDIIVEGVSHYDVYIKEVKKETPLRIVLRTRNEILDQMSIVLMPPRHWVVHVVQTSHHDVGYTDLPSNVIQQHNEHIDKAISMVQKSLSLPDDVQMRIVLEQAWSAYHFFSTMPKKKANALIALIKSGHVELTALFGNMTTELCSHEVLIRTLYHANRLKQEYGLPIVSAEHNDITGMSWGLCQILSQAGIKLLCAGLPLYYNWGPERLQSFWEPLAIFRHDGPGAFWWEAPDKGRVLLWCNNSGCGGDYHGSMQGLMPKLEKLSSSTYPYTVLRWPVTGARRDNSPYIDDYTNTIKNWNETFEYPRLVSSTNAKFYADLVEQLPSDLPVLRGELAGQDYPTGAMSTAVHTTTNRNNHFSLPTAEQLSCMARSCTNRKYPKDEIFAAYEDTLWHDEHSWGFHFPSGPAMVASEYEKAVHAHRAAARSHDISSKSMAAIADAVKKCTEGYDLVVFNPCISQRTAPVRAMLREMDNCGSTFKKVPPVEDVNGEGYLKGVLLHDRWHINLSDDFLEGKFEIVDASTNQKVPYQMIEIANGMETVPYAATRLGLGSGTKRYGMFEEPIGIKREICFIASDVPACGYKTYHLIQKTDMQRAQAQEQEHSDEFTIENEFYRVVVDASTGRCISIMDKSLAIELVDDRYQEGFFAVVVRNKNETEPLKTTCTKVCRKRYGPIVQAIEIQSEACGHPSIVQTILLYQGISQVFFESRILKDATPLQNTHIAFPFQVKNPTFRYEGALSVMEPIVDYLPGSYSDTVAVQNWVKIKGDHGYILWSSMDAPIVSFGDLWKGYISPAHRCVAGEGNAHPPHTKEDLHSGWIFSQAFCNNFGTNFSVSQVGDVLFRHVMTSGAGDVSDGKAASFGWQAVQPLMQIFARNAPQGKLPVLDSFIQIDNDNIMLLAFKESQAVGDGIIIRLWNMSAQKEKVTVALKYIDITSVHQVNIVETFVSVLQQNGKNSFSVSLEANSILTIAINAQEP